MEGLYGSGTDPVPYIVSVYVFGSVGVLGFSGWILWERARLRRLLATLAKPR